MILVNNLYLLAEREWVRQGLTCMIPVNAMYLHVDREWF